MLISVDRVFLFLHRDFYSDHVFHLNPPSFFIQTVFLYCYIKGATAISDLRFVLPAVVWYCGFYGDCVFQVVVSHEVFKRSEVFTFHLLWFLSRLWFYKIYP